jgi:hypothetical protein
MEARGAFAGRYRVGYGVVSGVGWRSLEAQRDATDRSRGISETLVGREGKRVGRSVAGLESIVQDRTERRRREREGENGGKSRGRERGRERRKMRL